MGIDIYLSGYEKRVAKESAAFDAASKECGSIQKKTGLTIKELLAKKNPEYQAALSKMNDAMESMNTGKQGYIRSSYNSGGLFNVLDTIFGIDTANYFFPGDWSKRRVPVNGRTFTSRVRVLERVAVEAIKTEQSTLPLTDLFKSISGNKTVGVNKGRASGEAFAKEMTAFAESKGFSTARSENGTPTKLGKEHGWYLTTGLSELFDFGKLATRLNRKGKKTYAEISF